jgi:hypothetical protein
MTMKKAGATKPGPSKGKLKKLMVKKETLADLSTDNGRAGEVRGGNSQLAHASVVASRG